MNPNSTSAHQKPSVSPPPPRMTSCLDRAWNRHYRFLLFAFPPGTDITDTIEPTLRYPRTDNTDGSPYLLRRTTRNVDACVVISRHATHVNALQARQGGGASSVLVITPQSWNTSCLRYHETFHRKPFERPGCNASPQLSSERRPPPFPARDRSC